MVNGNEVLEPLKIAINCKRDVCFFGLDQREEMSVYFWRGNIANDWMELQNTIDRIKYVPFAGPWASHIPFLLFEQFFVIFSIRRC